MVSDGVENGREARPQVEWWRDLAHMYVQMTITYHNKLDSDLCVTNRKTFLTINLARGSSRN